MAFKMRFRCDWPMKQQSNCSIVAMQRPKNSLFLMILGDTVRKAKPAHHQVIHRWNKKSNPRLQTPMFSGLVFPWSSRPKKSQFGDVPWASSMNAEVWWPTWLVELHGLSTCVIYMVPGPKSPPVSKQRCLGVYMSMYDLTSNVSHCMVCSGDWNDIMLWIIPNYDAILQSRHQCSTFRCTSNLIQLGVQCLKSHFFWILKLIQHLVDFLDMWADWIFPQTWTTCIIPK